MVVLSPIELKCPILTAFISPLMTAPYQTVAYFEMKTLPTTVAFGAIHASLTSGT